MAVLIGNASISENGTIKGKAGDQTGREVTTRKWYRHSKGWVTLEFLDPLMAEYSAEAMEMACANPDIGYNQYENQTLWNNVKDKGWNPSKTTKKVNTDCARLVRLCVQYAAAKRGMNITIPDFYTATLASVLMKTGLFKKHTESKYNTQDKYLKRGMIQVTKTKGHTWVILENGSKAEVIETEFVEEELELGKRILRNGMEGADVKELQGYLIQLGYDCGSWGDDGDFGDATELAVIKFQREHGCVVDGEVGPETLAALGKELEDNIVSNASYVEIVNGNCYARTAPNTSGKKLGVAYRGERFVYQGISENGWNLINYKNSNAWVSGKYSVLKKG